MKWIFQIIINLVATIIQIVVYPLNLAITSVLPDLSSSITSVINSLGQLFTSMGWILSGIPVSIKTAIIFILGVEIAKHTIFISTHALIKAWNILQKIKFW